MKKIISLLLCVGLIVSLLGVSDVKASDNNTPENALILKSNDIINDSLTSDEAEDWYKYVVPESGCEYFELISVNNEDFYMTIIELDEYDIRRDLKSYHGNEVIKTSEYSFEKGHTLYVKISRYANNNREYEYKLISHFSSDPLKNCKWAIKKADTEIDANDISSKVNICSVLNKQDDVDWYKYIVLNENPVSFKLTNTVNWDDYKITVYEYDSNDILRELGTFSGLEAISEEYTYKKGQIIYVKVQNCYGNSSHETKYIISVNDSFKPASKLDAPISMLVGTNIVVGIADAGATVNVKYGKKTYKAISDENGFYRVKTATLKKGKKLTIWQTVDKKSSEKTTVKVVEKY